MTINLYFILCIFDLFYLKVVYCDRKDYKMVYSGLSISCQKFFVLAVYKILNIILCSTTPTTCRKLLFREFFLLRCFHFFFSDLMLTQRHRCGGTSGHNSLSSSSIPGRRRLHFTLPRTPPTSKSYHCLINIILWIFSFEG